jgi:siroheme synthase-like protein
MDSKATTAYLPLYHRMQGQSCLVVGGGAVALRKTEQLLAAEADVTIVAPKVIPALATLIKSENIAWRQRTYETPAPHEYQLVIATTDDAGVNRKIYDDCKKLGIPVNVVDQPDLCTVIFPSVIRRGPITISVSSGGKIPYLTKELRKELEIFLASVQYLKYPELLMAFREYIQANVADFAVKKRLYQRLLASSDHDLSRWAQEGAPYDLWSQWIASERDA